MIKTLACHKAEPTVPSNQAVSSDDTTMNQVQWVENCLGLTGWTIGLDIALANLQAGFMRGFSDLETVEHEVVEDGDALVIRGQNTGVHTGPFLGVPPTGKTVTWQYLDMYRAGPDGRLNWHLLTTDWNLVRLTLLDQAPPLPTTPTRRAVQTETHA
jgi:predicted ester cyclase